MAAKKKAKTAKKVAKKTAKKASGNGATVTRMPTGFGGMVRQHRAVMGWSQIELGRAAGACAGWIGTIERGDALPSPALAKELMKALKFKREEKTAALERFPELRARKKAAG